MVSARESWCLACKEIDVEVSVVGQSVLSVDGYFVEGQRLGHRIGAGNGIGFCHHGDLCFHGVAGSGRVVADDKARDLVLRADGILRSVCLGLFDA